jgi:hypothetical protein
VRASTLSGFTNFVPIGAMPSHPPGIPPATGDPHQFTVSGTAP